MSSTGRGKHFGPTSLLFNPNDGTVVRTPPQQGNGWWAGAPGATYDPQTNTFYLVYRHRQPRELGRGVECRIAASDNGITFQDIWALPKTSWDALSIERCALVHSREGDCWRLYVSYVSGMDNRWRIGMMEAAEPDQFSVSNLKVIMTADSTGTEGVKDPNVFLIGPMYYMLVSYAAKDLHLPHERLPELHASGDIYNTGLTLSRTAAAMSLDGVSFRWLGDVSPNSGEGLIVPSGTIADEQVPWDAYCRRVGTLLPLDNGGYMALYDGSKSVSENYEERCGVAITFDLRNYHSLSHSGPSLVSNEGTGSLRYVDVLPVGHELFYYYERARADGSHDLCVSIVERG